MEPRLRKFGNKNEKVNALDLSHSKMVLPSITIVTPSFNQGKFIERTIQSVLGQNYPNLEYIVVDGGSTDDTLNVLKKFEGRLRWISEKDSGQSEAINKGFRLAKGEIVAWLNSDDVYLPGALEKVGRYFAAHPDVAMVYGEGYMIDENDAIKSRFPFTEPKFDLWKLIYFGDYILQQSTFFRRSIFDTIELLGESLHYTMDWDLFIRIGKRFRIDYLPEYLGSIREHSEAKTATGGPTRFREIKQIIRRHGVLRYPLAYFNYMWDAYGWSINDGGKTGLLTTIRSKMQSAFKRVLERAFEWYRRRLQQGVYSDGWIAKKAMIVLPNLNPDGRMKRLEVAGEFNGFNTPAEVAVRVNKKRLTKIEVDRPGHFTFTAWLSNDLERADCYHVQFECSRSFVPSALGVSTDSRNLAFLLKSVGVGYGSDADEQPSESE